MSDRNEINSELKKFLNNDVNLGDSDQNLSNDTFLVKKNTFIYQYFDWVKKISDKNQSLRRYEVIEIDDNSIDGSEHPFLTIVTRTVGDRPEPLQEVLLCLSAQKNQDFEVLIIGHNLDVERKTFVEQTISALPSYMKNKTRLLEVSGGTRTTPLNVGFENARGKYISILDDDDIVFDNYVDEFYKAYKENDGKILHAYSVMQDWECIDTFYDRKALRASASPNDVYCKNFNFVKQTYENYCPPMTLAFPSFVFAKHKVKFDESLTTTEDWDFLMRSAAICGVADIEKTTGIYRQWTGMANSQAMHNKEEWNKNRNIIIKKLKENPIYSIIMKDEKSFSYDLFGPTSPVVYIDDGSGFSEKNKIIKYENFGDKEDVNVKFSDFTLYEKIKAVRFDPGDIGLVSIKDIDVEIEFENDELETKKLKDLKINGIKFGNKAIFLRKDPWILIKLKGNKKIKHIKVKCNRKYFSMVKYLKIFVKRILKI